MGSYIFKHSLAVHTWPGSWYLAENVGILIQDTWIASTFLLADILFFFFRTTYPQELRFGVIDFQHPCIIFSGNKHFIFIKKLHVDGMVKFHRNNTIEKPNRPPEILSNDVVDLRVFHSKHIGNHWSHLGWT